MQRTLHHGVKQLYFIEWAVERAFDEPCVKEDTVTFKKFVSMIPSLVLAGILAVAATSAAKAQGTATQQAKKTAQDAADQASKATSSAADSATTAVTGKPTQAQIDDAKASGKVWVNTDTGIYHKSGQYFGNTKHGKFMTEQDAQKAGYHAAKNEKNQ